MRSLCSSDIGMVAPQVRSGLNAAICSAKALSVVDCSILRRLLGGALRALACPSDDDQKTSIAHSASELELVCVNYVPKLSKHLAPNLDWKHPSQMQPSMRDLNKFVAPI